jgi:signal transduction histidine kinase
MIFAVALICSALISGAIMYKLVDDFLVANEVNRLDSAVDSLSTLALNYISSDAFKWKNPSSEMVDSNDGAVISPWAALRTRMEFYRATMDAYIFITDDSGKILTSAPLVPTSFENNSGRLGILSNQILNQMKYLNGDYYFQDEKQYKTVNSGKDLVNKKDFYGLFAGSQSSSWLTYQKHYDAENINISISVQSPQLEQARSTVLNYFILSSLIGFLLAVIILMSYTRKVVRPIKELTLSAEAIASGDFHRELKHTSSDEIGTLIESFNSMSVSLEHLDQVRNDFIANVSHELRTPMTSIKGFIEGILDGVIPKENEEYYLELVHSEIMRLNSFINELIEMTKLQSGEQALNFSVYDINSQIKACVKRMEILSKEKNISIKTVFQNNTENVNADKGAIERVLINLIHNAIKFTPQGGLITVFTRRLDGLTEVTVQDNGQGIPPEEQDMIFERFYKTDKSRSVNKSGLGLGLAMVKKIMVAHKQDIRVESIPGKSKFIFTLSNKGNP